MADDIFSDDELTAHAAAEEQAEAGQQPEEQQQTDERPRDEHGRFVKQDGETEGKPPEGHVPQGALHAERERRKGAETELRKAQEALQAIANLRQQVNSRTATPEPQAQAQDDPNGIEYLKKQIADLQQQTTRVGQTLDNQTLAEQENAQIQSVLAHSEANYRAQVPDYDDAIRYVVQARAGELALYGMSPHEVRIALANEFADVAKSAIAQGKDPAELGYAIAQARGYRPNVEQQTQGKAAAKVDAIATARAQNRTIGAAAGSTPAGELTAEAIIAMSPEEFAALYDTPEGRKVIDSCCGAF